MTQRLHRTSSAPACPPRLPTWTAQKLNLRQAENADASGSSPAGDPLDYRPGDRIGRSGVEAAYDSHLRGLRGLRRITRNRYGEIVREETIRSPRPGGSVELTLNTAVQKKMERLLDAALTARPESDPQAADAHVPTGGALSRSTCRAVPCS